MPTDEFREAAEIEAETPITVGATKPDMQTLCNRILESTGDNRSCVETCGKCLGVASDHNLSGPLTCPACNGHGTTFRTDAVGRERIERAVTDWFQTLFTAEGLSTRRAFWSSVPEEVPVYARFLKAWDNRHGQPWADSLEAHVREWREDAPNYAADWNAMGRLLEYIEEKDGKLRQPYWDIHTSAGIIDIGGVETEYEPGTPMPQAVVRAVHAALCSKGE